MTLLLDNTFPSLVIHKDKRTSTERAQAKQAAPNPQIRIIAGLGHIHSDLFIMDIDCQSLVGNQFDGYGIRAPVAFAHLVIKLGYGIFAHAKVLYEDDTIAARGEGAVIVLAGDAEREALQLPVAAGLDDLQISTVG